MEYITARIADSTAYGTSDATRTRMIFTPNEAGNQLPYACIYKVECAVSITRIPTGFQQLIYTSTSAGSAFLLVPVFGPYSLYGF